MRRIIRRPVASFGLGALAAGTLFVSGVAYGSAGDDQIQACANKGNGMLYLVRGKGCQPGDTSVAWNIKGEPGEPGPPGPQGLQGPPGASGTFSGSLKSPNGLYAINVTDAGLELKGPGGSVKVTLGSVIVQGTVGLQLNAPIVSLNGGCTRVMRQNGAGVMASSSVYTC